MKIYFEKPKMLKEILPYCSLYEIKVFWKIVLMVKKDHSSAIFTFRKKTVLTDEEKACLDSIKTYLDKTQRAD